MDWFTVDKNGLAKILEKRGKAFALFELFQNAWDTEAAKVEAEIVAEPNKPYAEVTVTDDNPNGFSNLSHAFTLFAESEKKGDPSKRGRFNLGEKLVLALCSEAQIASTTGTVYFDAKGRRTSRECRPRGSQFRGVMRMTRAELQAVEKAIEALIPPPHCTTLFNGEELAKRPPIASFEASLPTETADEEGFLKRTARMTMVTVHEVLEGEEPCIYEMGIPVVPLNGGERWHINVHQKVPLNFDRDNVTPAYLQTIRVLLANEMKDYFTKEDAGQVWVNAATEDERVSPDTVNKVLDERFGEKRAIFDPSDPEANKQLLNEGYTVIPGGALSGSQWERVKSFGSATPSGHIRPTGVRYSPDGEPERIIAPENYTKGQRGLVEFTIDLAWRLIKRDIRVKLVNEMIGLPHSAWYGGGVVAFNVGRLGKAWFEGGITASHLGLIIHELAHDKVSDHLTREFADEVGRLSMKALNIALTEPDFFKYHGYKT